MSQRKIRVTTRTANFRPRGWTLHCHFVDLNPLQFSKPTWCLSIGYRPYSLYCFFFNETCTFPVLSYDHYDSWCKNEECKNELGNFASVKKRLGVSIKDVPSILRFFRFEKYFKEGTNALIAGYLENQKIIKTK